MLKYMPKFEILTPYIPCDSVPFVQTLIIYPRFASMASLLAVP